MNPTLQTLSDLRSIHGSFTAEKIPAADLDAILSSAVRAANASNRQSYSVIAVDEPETMEKLTGYRGSHILVFCVDFNRLLDTARLLGKDYVITGIAPFLTGAIDTCLAAQTAAIAAKSLGVDTLFTNGMHRGEFGRVFELLSLPTKFCFPLIALVLGYAETVPARLRGRLSGPGVIHTQRYQSASESELRDIITAYDDPNTNLGLPIPWKENGFDHFLDWFFEVWSTRFPAQEGRSQLFEWLIKTGFVEGEEVPE